MKKFEYERSHKVPNVNICRETREKKTVVTNFAIYVNLELKSQCKRRRPDW